MRIPILRFFLPFAFLLLAVACGSDSVEDTSSEEMAGPERSPMSFQQRQLVDSARFWWALTIGDVTNDGLMDIIVIDNNANGGHLAYYAGQTEDTIWTETIVAEAPPTGGTFASGDLETGDMDGDGDLDILAVKHTGEWDNAGESAELFWYENPSWEVHTIGEAPDAVKDISVADFDDDGKMDVSILTFDEGNLSVHYQQADGSFSRLLNKDYPNLHEGMDVGDLDGDGDVDITTNGYLFHNPGKASGDWTVSNIDPRWNNQDGDWSRNATKGATRDIDGDGTDEVFISHSERAGYPLAMYQRQEDGTWAMTTIADSIPACHTLQVFDMDMDGDLDVVAGVNTGRAVNLNKDDDQVFVFVNEGDYQNWTETVIANGGIYNGRVADFEGDGDYDLFRYPNHESREVFLLENRTLNK